MKPITILLLSIPTVLLSIVLGAIVDWVITMQLLLTAVILWFEAKTRRKYPA